jgi:DNA repair exonuclease SbcCD nuclease subunit
MPLFKKAACFTDIHFGLKGNSRIHNDDCEDFVYWFIEQAKKNNCETCIFLGDWHHHRSSTNVSTMNYTVSNMERLGQAFEKVYVIMGNHDLFYREKREINSMEFARNIPNITLVNKWLVDDDVAIIPWLEPDEHLKIPNMTQKYIFGHFEIPYFKMNAMVEMPDVGGIKAEHFVNQQYVFSGHFHKRQVRNNIHYIGNAFPHNYADAGDDERGMMILEHGGEPKYVNWPNMPVYRHYKISHLLDNADDMLKEKMYVRVGLDIKISYEEANFIRETFIDKYKLREFQLIPEQLDQAEAKPVSFEKFDSVDQIVIKQLEGVDSKTYDKQILMAIYNNLDVNN